MLKQRLSGRPLKLDELCDWGNVSMAGATFKTNPYDLHELLKNCDRGALQLPDFQRSWVWDEDRITSLIASISRAFPIGALMTLETGGEVDFKPRPVEGAPIRWHIQGARIEPERARESAGIRKIGSERQARKR